MSELDQDMTDDWLDSLVELHTRYTDWIKRDQVLLDYFDAIVQTQLLTGAKQSRVTEQMLEFSRWQLSHAVALKQTTAVNELSQLISERMSAAAACAATSDDSRHPSVTKFLTHLSDLIGDFELDIRYKEITVGREMADTRDKVGGSARFRALLETECDWLAWDDAERLMTNALDSPSSAQWDATREQIKNEIGEIGDEERS